MLTFKTTSSIIKKQCNVKYTSIYWSIDLYCSIQIYTWWQYSKGCCEWMVFPLVQTCLSLCTSETSWFFFFWQLLTGIMLRKIMACNWRLWFPHSLDCCPVASSWGDFLFHCYQATMCETISNAAWPLFWETGLAVGCDLRQMCGSLLGAGTQRPHQVQTETEMCRAKEQIREGRSISKS